MRLRSVWRLAALLLAAVAVLTLTASLPAASQTRAVQFIEFYSPL